MTTFTFYAETAKFEVEAENADIAQNLADDFFKPILHRLARNTLHAWIKPAGKNYFCLFAYKKGNVRFF